MGTALPPLAPASWVQTDMFCATPAVRCTLYHLVCMESRKNSGPWVVVCWAHLWLDSALFLAIERCVLNSEPSGPTPG